MLERLCGPLCDAVLDRTDSAAVLVELERTNLFLTALDERREWYHCHRLFRDALRRELGLLDADQVPLLTLRAADWFLGQGQVEEAVRHRLAAGDDDGAASLLTSRVRWFVDRGVFRTYLQLGHQVHPAVAHAHPDLCVSLAWAAALTGRVDLVRPWLDAAEPALTDQSPPLHGWRSLRAAARTVRALSGYLGTTHRAAAIADAEEAVSLEADPAVSGCAVARMALGRVLQDAGEPEAAVDVLSDALRLPVVAKAPGILRLQAAGALWPPPWSTPAESRRPGGDPAASAATLAEAHATAESESTVPVAMRELEAAEARIGRHRTGRAGEPRQLVEELTEREVSILRALQGRLSQREIGAEMFISVNTVKGYTKSLYRKLDVTSRQAAVQRGRALGLI